MQKYLKQIKSLPLYVQIIIASLPSVLLIALFVFFIYMPKNEEIGSLETRLVKLDTDILSAESKVKRLDDLIAENELLKRKLSRLKEQLPEEEEVSVLLKQISELGLRSGLEILLWKPAARKTEPQGLYVEIPVDVEVITEYHKLGDFYSHVSRLPRLVNISDMEITAGRTTDAASRGIINAKFTARTFASATPDNTAPAAVPKK